MGSDTVMMKWRQLLEDCRKSPAPESEVAYRELKEHEKYMVDKGYTIKFTEVISPEGVTVWKRVH